LVGLVECNERLTTITTSTNSFKAFWSAWFNAMKVEAHQITHKGIELFLVGFIEWNENRATITTSPS
jgi:hypothetical protein